MHKPTPVRLWFAATIMLLAIAAYLPGMWGGFALDDYTNVVNNPAITVDDLSWHSLSQAIFSFQAGPTMRPVSMLSFTLNAYFTGADGAMAFKITNLVIHLINGLLMGWLLIQSLAAYRSQYAPRLPEDRIAWLAALVAALWLLHPLNVMPVLYVVQRETSLSGLFVLLGLGVYVWARRRILEGRSGGWALWTLVPLATLVATLCKESGALLPVYALTIETFLFRFRSVSGGFHRGVAGFYLLFLLLPGCAGLAWMVLAHHGGFLDYSNRDYGMGQRLLSEARVVWLYIRWTLVPYPAELGLYHDDVTFSRGLLQPPTTLLSIVGLAALATTAAVLRRRAPLASLGIAWFLGGQLMESTIFPLELVYEHRCYLADMGLILGVLALAQPMLEERRDARLPCGMALALLTACTLITATRAYDWRDNLSFAQSEAAHHPQSPYATYMLGQTYANLALFSDESQYDNAVDALRAASRVPDSSVISDVSLVLVEAQLKGDVEPGALDRIGDKLANRRINASDLQAIGALVDCVNRKNCRLPADGMERVFTRALTNPHLKTLMGPHADILVNYGNFVMGTQPDGAAHARRLMEQAVALVPAEAQYRANLVTMDITMGDAARARTDLDALRKLNYLGHLDAQIVELEARIAQMPPPH